MIISLTGTPGTGKTKISNILEKKSYNVIHLNDLIKKKNLFFDMDKKRKSRIVDTEKIDEHLSENITKEGVTIIESHLSHLLKTVDKVIILRCNPKTLKKRLQKRKWGREKINENIQAEALDIILCETLELFQDKNVFEINTTDKTPEEVCSCIIEMVDNKFKTMEKYRLGKIDWSEQLLNMNLKG